MMAHFPAPEMVFQSTTDFAHPFRRIALSPVFWTVFRVAIRTVFSVAWIARRGVFEKRFPVTVASDSLQAKTPYCFEPETSFPATRVDDWLLRRIPRPPVWSQFSIFPFVTPYM